jgi:hypothetical protein
MLKITTKCDYCGSIHETEVPPGGRIPRWHTIAGRMACLDCVDKAREYLDSLNDNL